MRKVIIIALFLLLMVAACSDDGPSVLPGFNQDGTGEGETTVASENGPRAEAPTPTMLPPTFTPAPMTHEGHLFLIGNYSGTRTIHIVQPGDTLVKLCERYGVPVEDLARINNISNVDHIEVGDALIIPLPRTDG